MSRYSLCAGAAFGLSGVVLGAWGAHGLAAFIGRTDVGAWQTAVQYQFVHALLLLIVGVLLRSVTSKALSVSVHLVVAGLVLFSGSIYALMLGGPSWLGPITPIGGVLLISAWAALFGGVARLP